ncbi:stimulated by retinoic acid gene 6 protein-like [Ptychodera flava]|uniref:stimulated by retinoic acid gene 6 protein-like n=1 Tax=Ptychodera flava TaxID=63121 RepID=UPI003969E873
MLSLTRAHLFNQQHFINLNKPTITPCSLPSEDAENYILILSILFIVLLSLLRKRKRLWLGRFDGRPGLIYPVNLLDDRRNRLAYAAAFVLASAAPVTELISQLLLGKSPEYSNGFMIVVVRILKALVYCLYCYPIFVAVTLESIVTYGLGVMYSLTLLALNIADVFACDVDERTRTFASVMKIPVFISLLYLSVIFIYKLVRSTITAVKSRKLDIILHGHVYDAYQTRHVRKLLLSVNKKMELTMSNDISAELGWRGKLKRILHRIYKPEPGFKYSTRLVSTVVVSLVAVYTVFVVFIYLWELRMVALLADLDSHAIYVLKVCWNLSLSITFVIFLFTIPMILQGYRENMLSVFKGDHSLVTAVAENTSFSITPAMRVVSATRYGGFQVAYAVVGFVIHFIVIMAVIGLISWIIVSSEAQGIFLDLLTLFWPIVVIGLFITLLQYLLARFVFLQERGRVFALDNRRLFHNCTFFTFFYNIYLGLFSSLMRLFKGMFFGALLFPRLDHSVLPRVVERFDPGFRAYIGFLQLENAHTHPVLVCFCRLLLLSLQPECGNGSKDEAVISADRDDDKDMFKTAENERRRRLARNRWFLGFTLMHNPGLQLLRHPTDTVLRSVEDGVDAAQTSDRCSESDE